MIRQLVLESDIKLSDFFRPFVVHEVCLLKKYNS